MLPLPPEFVLAQDGAEKQDCERNAAKRWLGGHGAEMARLGATVLGDDLYCHEPFCRELQSLGLGFVLVCKPDSHPTTYEWLEDLERNGAVGMLAGRVVGARHAEHVLAEVGEDQVVRHRRDLVEARLAELSLDVVLLGKPEAAMGLHAGFGRRPVAFGPGPCH